MKKDKELEALLRAAMHEAAEAAKPPRDPWIKNGYVELIYSDEEGHLSSLGVFNQFSHCNGNGRRLTRHGGECPECDIPIEFVYGEYWVEAHQTIIPEDSIDEIEALKSRFWELLEEFEIEE